MNNKLPLTKEKAYQLALQRGLIKPKETNDHQKSPLTKEKAYQLALQRGLIKPKEQESFGHSVGRSFARGAKDTIVGFLDMADLLGSPIREGINLGAKALSSNYRMQPMGEMTSQTIDKASHGYTKSETPEQHTQEAILRGVASMIPGVGAGNILSKGVGMASKALGRFLKASSVPTASNIAGTAATTGLMQNYLNNNPDDTFGAIGAGLVGGLGAHSAIGASKLATKLGRQSLSERMGRNIGQKIKINPNAIEDFMEAGITPTLPDVSDGKIIKAASHTLGYVPGSSGTIERAKTLQKNQILQGLGQGESADVLSKTDASALATKGTSSYRNSQNQAFSKMFKRVEEDVSKLPDTNVKPTHTFDMLDNSIKSFKTPKMYQNFAKTPYGQELMELHKTASEYGGIIPYEHLKQSLDNINDKITTHGLIGKSSQGKLKKLAETISKDIEGSLGPKFKHLSEDAYNNWKESRKLYHIYAQEDVPHMNELFKADKKGAVNSFLNLMTNQKKGAEKAKIIMKGLNPKEQFDLSTSMQHKLGEISDGTFSSLKWVRSFKSLEPQAQSTILSPLSKESQKKVHSIANVIDHMKGTLAEANTSKTAYHNLIGALGVAGAGAATSLLSGNIWPAAKIATGLLVSKLGAEALTSPKLINWTYNGMRMKTIPQLQRHLKTLENTSNLSKSVLRELQFFQKELEH